MRAVLVAPNAIGGPMVRGDNLLDPDAVAGQDLEVKSFRESRSTLKVSVNGPFTISDCIDE